MKNLLALIIFLLVTIGGLVSLTTIASDTDQASTTGQEFSDVLELELIQGLQNPRTKEFEYFLRVKSLIDTDRVRMNWEFLEGYAGPVKGESLSDQVLLKKDEEVYIVKKFRALKSGNDEIRVTGIAFGPSAVYDYFSFTDTRFTLDKDLQIAPNNPDYKTAVNISTTLNYLKIILGISTTIFVLLIIYYRFRLWLDSDD